MKVQEICTMSPRCCAPNMNLSQAVAMMWEADCGMLPVVDDGNHVVGVITDRDIAVATGTRCTTSGQITVAEAMSGNVSLTKLTDELAVALNKMAERQVRRLPVVDDKGKLTGVLSLNDVVLAVHGAMHGAPTTQEVLRVFAAICVSTSQLPVPVAPVKTPAPVEARDRRPTPATSPR